MAKADTRSTKTRATATKSSKRLADSAKAAEPKGDDTHLMTAKEETKLREQATKPAAVKEAVKSGKKDPIAKFGDPDADPAETAARRATFG